MWLRLVLTDIPFDEGLSDAMTEALAEAWRRVPGDVQGAGHLVLT